MKSFTSIALTTLISLSFLSCSKSSSDAPAMCGTPLAKQQIADAVAGTIVTDPELWTENNILTTLSGNERSYMLQLKQEHLCSHELTEAAFQVNTSSFQGTSLTTDMLGRADWGEGKSKETYFCKKGDGSVKSGHQYKGIMPIDVASDFPQGDATIRTSLIIRFNTLGTIDMDNLYFRNKYQSISMRISGRNP